MGAATVITILGAVLPSLIQWAEGKWGGNKTGPQKQAAVLAAATVLAQTAAGAGKAPAVSSDDLAAAIEATLSSLKVLGAVPSGSASPAGRALILTGTLNVQG